MLKKLLDFKEDGYSDFYEYLVNQFNAHGILLPDTEVYSKFIGYYPHHIDMIVILIFRNIKDNSARIMYFKEGPYFCLENIGLWDLSSIPEIQDSSDWDKNFSKRLQVDFNYSEENSDELAEVTKELLIEYYNDLEKETDDTTGT